MRRRNKGPWPRLTMQYLARRCPGSHPVHADMRHTQDLPPGCTAVLGRADLMPEVARLPAQGGGDRLSSPPTVGRALSGEAAAPGERRPSRVLERAPSKGRYKARALQGLSRGPEDLRSAAA